MALPTIGDSLAGRIEIIKLLPFAQVELHGHDGTVIDRLCSAPLRIDDAIIDSDLVELVARGGYPEAIVRDNEQRRTKSFYDCLAFILDRDVRYIAEVEQLGKPPKLLRMFSEQVGQISNITNLSSGIQFSRATVVRYIETLEHMYLIDTIPSWISNRMSRLIESPKLQYVDSGLLAAVRNFNPQPEHSDPNRLVPCWKALWVLNSASCCPGATPG